MHSRQSTKGIICHGDLKGVRSSHILSPLSDGSQSNYLVHLEMPDPQKPGTSTPNITGKITDFGLSSIIGIQFQLINSKVTEAFKWRAPELAKMEAGETVSLEKSDVWSFAITSLEVDISSGNYC